MKIAWCTDIHQDFLSPFRREIFLKELETATADAFLITGDISTARELYDHMKLIAARVSAPIYYVLGNHDYWHGSFESVREIVARLEQEHPNLIYLGNRSYIKLTEDAALVGHDAWYDAVNGEWKTSGFEMPDWYFIKDYIDAGCAQFYARGHWLIDLPKVVGTSRAIAARCAAHIENGIKEAIDAGFKRVIVATHVPPFPEAHMHEGKVGDEHAQPWFTSGLLGDVLDGASYAHPDRVFVSLSGHTHGDYHGSRRHNLHVHVGGAHYGRPHIQTIVNV